jgi:hypothetical protein
MYKIKMESSVNSVMDLGNTKTKSKQVNPSKYWCFTLNNYKKEDINNISVKVFKYCIGEEVGESGTPHLQGYIEFEDRKRPMSVFKEYKNIHWEKRKGSAMEAARYCRKDGKFITNIKYKKEVKVLKDNLLNIWEKEILKIIKEEPDDRTIYWFKSKCGAGKTTFCKYLCVKYGAIVLGGKSADMKNGIITYKNQNEDMDPEVILVNLPKTFDIGYLSYTGIEECKDMMFYSGKYEGGMVCGNCPHLIIFSNEMPDLDKVGVDRWKVYDIDTLKYVDINKNVIED